MATTDKEDVQARMKAAMAAKDGKPATEGDQKPAEDDKAPATTPTTAPATTPVGGVTQTSEFTDEDPKYPHPKSTEVSRRAAEPIRTRIEKDDEGKDLTIGTFRVHEKGTPIDAFIESDYKIAKGDVLTDEGRESVRHENEKLAALREEKMAKLLEDKGQAYKLQSFTRKHTTYMIPVVRNEVAFALGVKTKVINKDVPIAQKGMAISINEKGTGPVLSHVLIVPKRAYEVLSGGQAITDEQVLDIISEEAPELKTVFIPKADFATAQIAIFGGFIKVAPEFFDSNASKVAKIEDIPSVNGLDAGAEYITFELDNSKCFIATAAKPVERKPDETDDSFNARVARQEQKMKLTQDYKAGKSTLEQKASIIATKNTMHKSLATEKNYLPVNTFDTVNIGKQISAREAADLNSIYLGALVDAAKTAQTQPTADAMEAIRVAGGSIQDSIYFPAEAAFVGKVPTVSRLFRTRKADGTTEKPKLIPKAVVKKMRGKTADGNDTIVTCKNEIGTPGYRLTKYNMLKELFDAHMDKVPEAQRANISFPSYEEIKAAVSKQRTTSTKARLLSSTGFDRNAIDIQAMMADLSLGNGELILAANAAQESIKEAKKSKTKTVDTFQKFSPEALRSKIAK